MNKVVFFKYCGFLAGIGSAFILAAFLQPEETSKYAAMLSLINILIPVLSFGLPTMILWSSADEGLSRQVKTIYSAVLALSAIMLLVSLFGLLLGHHEALLLMLLCLSNIARCNAAYVRVNRSSVAAALFESLGLKATPAFFFLVFALYMGLTLWGVVALQALCALMFILVTYEYGSKLIPASDLSFDTVKTAAKKASLQFVAVAAKEVDSIIALALTDATTAVAVFLGKRAYAVGSVINESSRLIYQPDFSSVGVRASIAPKAYWIARNKNMNIGTVANITILFVFLLVCNAIDQIDALSEYFDVSSESFGVQTQVVVAIYLLARCVENLFGPVEQYLVMQDLHARAALVNISTVLLKGSVFLIGVSGLYGVAYLAFVRTLVLAAIWWADWTPKRGLKQCES